MSIGKLYFNGNAIDNSFKKDLKLAYQYFEKVDTEQILKSFKGKTVLVTGGGGSIGSAVPEIMAMIATKAPEALQIGEEIDNSI